MSGTGSGFESERRSLDTAAGLLTVALEGMEDGAIAAGLPPATVGAFVRQTLLSTALLLKEHGCSPAELKDQVASPAGTTIAGLAVLEEEAVRGSFMRAMETGIAGGRGCHDGGASQGSGVFHGAGNGD